MNVRLARDSAGILAYEHHSLFTEALKFTILLVLRMQLSVMTLFFGFFG
jgi:hypothetical protein